MKRLFLYFVAMSLFAFASTARGEEGVEIKESLKTEPVKIEESAKSSQQPGSEYIVGVEDILEIGVLQPEKLLTTVTVAPDGSISFPYVGNIYIKGMTLTGVQDMIQKRLADGYMKYPVVSVSLKESRSRKFFVYGEIMRPGTYLLEENTTVLRAISMAGGFTKFGSSSRVKVLQPKKSGAGYETIKVNINAVMNGDPNEDILLQPGDIVVVSEGVF